MNQMICSNCGSKWSAFLDGNGGYLCASCISHESLVAAIAAAFPNGMLDYLD